MFLIIYIKKGSVTVQSDKLHTFPGPFQTSVGNFSMSCGNFLIVCGKLRTSLRSKVQSSSLTKDEIKY